jgi:hypothetical protein
MSATIKSGSDRTLVNQDNQPCLLAYDATNDLLRRIRITPGGDLEVLNYTQGEGIALGLLVGKTNLNKFGYNGAVGATEEPVWDGSAAYSWQTSAQALEILSSNDEDASGGVGGDTGAQTVQIYGLDANYAEQNETVTLKGQTAVDLTKTYIRVSRMIVRTAGSAGKNLGTLTLRLDGGGVTQAIISIGRNQTLMCLWTVTAGMTLYLTEFFGSVSVNKTTEFILKVRPFGEVFQTKKMVTLNQDYADFPYKHPLVIQAKSDVSLDAQTSVGGGIVSGGFSGWYE